MRPNCLVPPVRSRCDEHQTISREWTFGNLSDQRSPDAKIGKTQRRHVVGNIVIANIEWVKMQKSYAGSCRLVQFRPNCWRRCTATRDALNAWMHALNEPILRISGICKELLMEFTVNLIIASRQQLTNAGCKVSMSCWSAWGDE